MLAWEAFAAAAPDIAETGLRLLDDNEVAFLATVSDAGRPRIHPFVPRVVQDRLLAFIMDTSPKIRDLRTNAGYAIHTLPGAEDEEFFIGGLALEVDADSGLRRTAADAMGFATGVDEHHILFEFSIDRALWTRWLDFGTADHRPEQLIWTAAAGSGGR